MSVQDIAEKLGAGAGADREVLVARALDNIAQWESDLAEIRRSIAWGRVGEAELFTLQRIAAERQQRIDGLRRLI
ncbi:hypothetical protein V2E29_04490 [Streptomyces diastatochromogenes]|uniref:hypothetical protein n=1 Tax=Streptomyces diastatochromogenes TaxID=42236 RepID=UPI002F25FF4D